MLRPDTLDDSVVSLSLESRMQLFRRRRRTQSVKEWMSLAATGIVGLWIAAIAVITLIH